MNRHPIRPHALWALACLLCLGPTTAVQAEIYKQVMPDGSVVYSDEPAPGAEVVELPPPQIVPAAPLPAPSSATPAGARAQPAVQAVAYRLVKITQPGDDAQIRENSGRVEISIQVMPALQTKAGHRLVIRMDNHEVATSTGNLHFVLENVDRGTHVLSAEIQDSRGRVLARSRPVTFHLFRHSRLQGRRGGS